MTTNPTAIAAQVEQLHACYSTFVHCRMPLTFSVREGWERWLFAGFTKPDLELVLRYWQKQIKRGMSPGVLRFRRLIRDTETFSEDLVLARIDKNGCRSRTPKERVVQQYERPVGEGTPALTPVTAKSAADWMRGMEILRKAAQ